MRVLVTGGRGFIARNLLEQLGTRFEITALGPRALDLLDAEGVRAYLRHHPFDVVIHTATYDAAPKHSTKDPTKVLERNLLMFFSLARCCDDFGKLIYFGSGAEFDRNHWSPRMPESYFDRHVPSDQYGFSKYIMTKYSMAVPNVINLRLFATFGKYEDWRVRVTSDVCHKVVQGLPITIHHDRRYDFLFIDDLMRVVEWFIRNEPMHSVYNVCSGEVVSFAAIARRLLEVTGKDLPVQIIDQEDRLEYSGDNALLLEQIPDLKFTPFNSSIEALYRWYCANPAVFDSAP